MRLRAISRGGCALLHDPEPTLRLGQASEHRPEPQTAAEHQDYHAERDTPHLVGGERGEVEDDAAQGHHRPALLDRVDGESEDEEEGDGRSEWSDHELQEHQGDEDQCDYVQRHVHNGERADGLIPHHQPHISHPFHRVLSFWKWVPRDMQALFFMLGHYLNKVKRVHSSWLEI